MFEIDSKITSEQRFWPGVIDRVISKHSSDDGKTILKKYYSIIIVLYDSKKQRSCTDEHSEFPNCIPRGRGGYSIIFRKVPKTTKMINECRNRKIVDWHTHTTKTIIFTGRHPSGAGFEVDQHLFWLMRFRPYEISFVVVIFFFPRARYRRRRRRVIY